jgi:glyoxylase-like metal-dependent hydrolase (beta-lactamase superfamily II)
MKFRSVYRQLTIPLLAVLGILSVQAQVWAEPVVALSQVKWIHGSPDCSKGIDPPIQVFQQDKSTWVLRQNKCLSFEAPFMYLLLGDDRALLLDTGATDNPESFPLYTTVRSLIGERSLLVLHSHSHGDHCRGDEQFTAQAGVELVAPHTAGLRAFLDAADRTGNDRNIELGGRKVFVLETPGHQEESITLYDSQTRWLLTGDTVYPGLIYVKDWEAYRESISRVARFARNHAVVAVLGAHIEMTDRAGEHYPIGTVYQPHEAPLPLSPKALQTLDTALAKADGKEAVQLDEFVIQPMNAMQRTLSNVARFFTQ